MISRAAHFMDQVAATQRCEDCGRELPPANAQLHALRCPKVLGPGTRVLYQDHSQTPPTLRDAEVVAVDRTLQPPAYTVRVGESERETERARLFVNRPASQQVAGSHT